MCGIRGNMFYGTDKTYARFMKNKGKDHWFIGLNAVLLELVFEAIIEWISDVKCNEYNCRWKFEWDAEGNWMNLLRQKWFNFRI